MSGSSMVSKIEELITQKLEELGVELVDTQYCKQNGDQFIRIFIDTESGVDLDLCSRVNIMVRDLIDLQDNIYYDHIEVSSPGVDRILKKDTDFQRFHGKMVKIRTKQLINNQRNFTGILKGADEDNITIEIENREIAIPRDIITVARLFPEI